MMTQKQWLADTLVYRIACTEFNLTHESLAILSCLKEGVEYNLEPNLVSEWELEHKGYVTPRFRQTYTISRYGLDAQVRLKQLKNAFEVLVWSNEGEKASVSKSSVVKLASVISRIRDMNLQQSETEISELISSNQIDASLRTPIDIWLTRRFHPSGVVVL